MPGFYSDKEFRAQVQELMDEEGLSYRQAYDRVLLQEMQDQEDHEELMHCREHRLKKFDDA